jgi:hypothetical protein
MSTCLRAGLVLNVIHPNFKLLLSGVTHLNPVVSCSRPVVFSLVFLHNFHCPSKTKLCIREESQASTIFSVCVCVCVCVWDCIVQKSHYNPVLLCETLSDLNDIQGKVIFYFTGTGAMSWIWQYQEGLRCSCLQNVVLQLLFTCASKTCLMSYTTVSEATWMSTTYLKLQPFHVSFVCWKE